VRTLLHLTLFLFLSVSVCHSKQDAWWVFFVDRGPGLEDRLSERTEELRGSPSWLRRAEAGVSTALPSDLLPWDGYLTELVSVPVSLTLRTRSRFLNAVSIDIDSRDLPRIADLPFVSHVRPVAASTFRCPELTPIDGTYQGVSDLQLRQIGLDMLNSRGWTGKGIVVGVLDSGFNLEHEVFESTEVIAMYDFVDDDPDPSQQSGDPPGQSDHGTAVLSIMGGYVQDQFVGGVPDAGFILAKTEDTSDEYQAEEDYWVAGLEWVESNGADLVNSSLGYIDWYQYPDLDGNTAVTTIAADAAAARGMVVYNSIGNEGPQQGTLIAPADGDSVFAAGAVDAQGYVTDFSSRGPTADGRFKPDGCALGQSVALAYQGTSGYSQGNGTSFSSPLIASAAAAVAGAHPEWGMNRVMEILRITASQWEYPDNEMGYGIIDAYAALRYCSVTGIIRSSCTFQPLQDYPVQIVMEDTVLQTSSNDKGWFAVCPGELGGFSILQASGSGNVIPVSGTLDTAGVEVDVYVDQQAASAEPSVYPNPSFDGVYVGFDVTEGPVDAELTVYDITLQEIYHEERTGIGPGSFRAPLPGEAFHWDGKTEDGQRSASGIYIAVLRIGDDAELLKFSIVR
jgi:hypothetical protein